MTRLLQSDWMLSLLTATYSPRYVYFSFFCYLSAYCFCPLRVFLVDRFLFWLYILQERTSIGFETCVVLTTFTPHSHNRNYSYISVYSVPRHDGKARKALYCYCSYREKKNISINYEFRIPINTQNTISIYIQANS